MASRPRTDELRVLTWDLDHDEDPDPDLTLPDPAPTPDATPPKPISEPLQLQDDGIDEDIVAGFSPLEADAESAEGFGEDVSMGDMEGGESYHSGEAESDVGLSEDDEEYDGEYEWSGDDDDEDLFIVCPYYICHQF